MRASEYAISDHQLSDPVAGQKLAGEVRKVLSGDTSTIEARQTQAIAAEYQRAKLDLAAGDIDDHEFAAIEAQVREIAPDAIEALPAIAAEAVPVDEPVAAAPKQSAYQRIVASPFRSRFFLGGQRTGKSRLAVGAAAAASAKGVEIYYLNLASWGTEDDEYAVIAQSFITANIQALTADQASATVKDAVALIQKFYISSKPSILIFEEWAELGSRNHQHKDLLDGLLTYSASVVEQLANTGQKRRKAIYATGPMFVAGSLQQATKAAKSMELVLVAIAPSKTVYWHEQALSFNSSVMAQALANWHGVSEPIGSFDSDRIALCEGAWVPVGDLPALPLLTALAVNSTITLAVDADDSVIVDIAPVAVSTWSKVKAKLIENDSPYIGFADWVESRNGQSFSIEQAKENKKARTTIPDTAPGNSQRDRVEHAIKCLAQWGALVACSDGSYSQA